MELRPRHLKGGKAQTIPRLGFETQRKFSEEGGSFQSEPTQGRSLLEILSFATSYYATGMQLIVIYNYLGHICNYKFGIV